MTITTTELNTNLGKYLLLSQTEDILITHNDSVIAKLFVPDQDRLELSEALLGVWAQRLEQG